MKVKSIQKYLFLFIVFTCLFLFNPHSLSPQQQSGPEKQPEKQKDPKALLMKAFHSISSHRAFDYVKELCSEKFSGRLTGTEGYNKSADYIVNLFKQWGVKPGGENNTWFQDFPNPYTLVLDAGQLTLHLPHKKKSVIDKHYTYQDDYLPGSTSGSGKLKAEVIYVGYGITAPELGFDEYKGLDVKGKIVMMEREVPVRPLKDPELFKKWRPYSFHQYKVKNAFKHGAAGMLYIYHIANPNCTYIKELQLTQIGDAVVKDLFTGTGRNHKQVVKKIKKTLKPQSFKTGKMVTMANTTEHHAEGIARNVLGLIEGTDPQLKHEYIMIGAHLDHLGMNHKMMPGANDNASGVAVAMEIARAISGSGMKSERSIIFNLFGAEEQGVAGSDYYLKHPVVPNDKIIALLNMDGVGRGERIYALAGKRYPEIFKYVREANEKYIHRRLTGTNFSNLARPRLDAARFMWAGVPTLSFSTGGGEPLPYAVYHKTLDDIDIITPEIMEDLGRLLFITTMQLVQNH